MAHGATHIGRPFQGDSGGQGTGAGGEDVAHGVTQAIHFTTVVVDGGMTLTARPWLARLFGLTLSLAVDQ